jgi:protein gp37
MGKTTAITWTDSTFNPWIGCTKVSPGCAHCYAERLMDHRMGKVKWGEGQPRLRTSEAKWREPRKWNWNRTATSPRHRVFCGSLCDWLEEATIQKPDGTPDPLGIQTRTDLLELIYQTPQLTWQLLTKRPDKFHVQMARCLDEQGRREGFPREGKRSKFGDWLVGWLGGRRVPENVWLGVSAEDQTTLDQRHRELHGLPAAKRFLSLEPLLEGVNLVGTTRGTLLSQLDWLIVGGESGPQSRDFHVDWVRTLMYQAQKARVPVFVKQLGSHCVARTGLAPSGTLGDWPIGTRATAISPLAYLGTSVRVRLRDRKGGDMEEWPLDLRWREVPA